MAWIKSKDRIPNPGEEVLCRLKHVFSGSIKDHRLIHVDEDDCTWRTADDGSEIDYSWDVVEWEETTDMHNQES
ncbi:hypothetical protein [Pseudomonas sp. NPDC089569]|uniref:hypothetical protein n=1 Tax=Pseudomonas sp. NPDC089569 TaxID=3390722 RepID=UPI003CFD7309